jgi:hypothetical protein
MEDLRFEIVFAKLAEAQLEDAKSDVAVSYSGESILELREIDELRRFSMEVSEAKPILFTRS